MRKRVVIIGIWHRRLAIDMAARSKLSSCVRDGAGYDVGPCPSPPTRTRGLGHTSRPSRRIIPLRSAPPRRSSLRSVRLCATTSRRKLLSCASGPLRPRSRHCGGWRPVSLRVRRSEMSNCGITPNGSNSGCARLGTWRTPSISPAMHERTRRRAAPRPIRREGT
jgi:hypothetical protein